MSTRPPAGTTPAHASPVDDGLHTDQTHDEAAQKTAPPYLVSQPKLPRASTLKQRTAILNDDDGVSPKVHKAITFAEPAPQLSERDSIFADHYVSTHLEAPVHLGESGGDDGDEYTNNKPGDSNEVTAGPTVTTSAMSTVLTQTASPARSPNRDNLAKARSVAASKYKLSQYHPVTSKQNVPGSSASGRGTIHGVRRVNSDGHTWTKKFHLNVEQQHPNDDDLTEEPEEMERNQTSTAMLESSKPAEPGASKAETLTSVHAMAEASQAARNERSVSRGRARVDKSIEAKVKNPETSGNVRSRKASHMMGIFDPQDIKSIEDLVEGTARSSQTHSRASPDVSEDSLPQFNGDYFQGRTHVHRPESIYEEGADELEPVSPTGPAPVSSTERSSSLRFEPRNQTTLPSALLHEIRTSTRDQLTSILPDLHITKEQRDELERPIHAVDNQEPGHDEEEHISAAVYYPHAGPTPEEIENFEYHDDHDVDAHSRPSDEHSNVDQRGAEPRVSSDGPAHIDVSVESPREQTRLHLHGDLQSPRDTEEVRDDAQDDEESARTPRVAAVDDRSRLASISASESDLEYGDGSGRLDEGATTPKQKDILMQRDRSGSTVSKPKGRVVLEPYKHQVGGHSTMYHLSRRAVCKQLNNRENEFYERIEQTHPDLLKFMPRYIGVLNVTFSKGPKQNAIPSKDSRADVEAPESGQEGSKARSRSQPASQPSHSNGDVRTEATHQPRIVSHSQQIDTLPQVILNQNKHIIPPNYFDLPERPKSADPQHLRRSSGGYNSESGDLASPNSSENNSRSPARPMHPVHSPSWGTTTVNVGLRDRILREVFGPPPIKYHKRGHHSHSTLPKAKSPSLRRRSNLSIQSYDMNGANGTLERPHTAHQTEATTNLPVTKSLRPDGTLSPSTQYSTSASVFEELRNDLSKVSSANSDSANTELSDDSRQLVRRRHSGMGLRRRRKSVSDTEVADLEYIEDEALMLRSDDEVFAMDEDSIPQLTRGETAPAELEQMQLSANSNLSDAESKNGNPAEQPPSNPRAARSKHHDQRYEMYIVLEDLTSGMGRPCILDLKMGTRQYGIEARRSKVESQRRKCKTTTSGQLGVRICGMQTFNAGTRTAGYEDKYFGRDVRAGREFREALVRFLYDGISYKSVARHIPTLLHRLSKLESMVRRLPGYRFYGSSLILYYDAEPENSKEYQEAMKRGVDILKEKQEAGKKWPPSIELKLIDFANCVTSEDELPHDTHAPPAHPHEIDRGYLRGLKTLKVYFTQILKDIQSDDSSARIETEDVILGDNKASDGHETHGHRGTDYETEEEGEVSI